MTFDRDDEETDAGWKTTRRGAFRAAGAVVVIASTSSGAVAQQARPAATAAPRDETGAAVPVRLRVNGHSQSLMVDPRTTLLDALRENLGLGGTKKGCDHGQCGACTVLVEGRRINSCLALAVMHDGESVTTIEGLGTPDRLHPMQAAFLAHDGFQCGYCTPGQICSAVGMLEEARAGMPSVVTEDLSARGAARLVEAEVRERMSGNLCRCSAYPNIVAAIREVAGSAAGGAG